MVLVKFIYKYFSKSMQLALEWKTLLDLRANQLETSTPPPFELELLFQFQFQFII